MARIIDSLNASDLRRLKSFFENGKIAKGTKTKLTGVVRLLHECYALGEPLPNQMLSLSSHDLIKIRKLIKDESKFDLLEQTLPSSRIEMSLYFPFEKLYNGDVKGKLVKLFGIKVTKINCKKYELDEGMCIEIELDKLLSIEHKQMILVENYEAFAQFRKVNTDIDDNVLVVYRGDKETSILSKDLSERFPNIKLIAWCDLDPQGISIAIASGAQAILLPKITPEQIEKLGRTNLFYDQEKSWSKISELIPKELTHLISTSKKGITQESMIANNISLFSYSITTKFA